MRVDKFYLFIYLFTLEIFLYQRILFTFSFSTYFPQSYTSPFTQKMVFSKGRLVLRAKSQLKVVLYILSIRNVYKVLSS